MDMCNIRLSLLYGVEYKNDMKAEKTTATSKELRLLHFINKSIGGGITTLLPKGEDYTDLNMGVLRSIEKKGFVVETNNIWFLTELGKEVVSKNKAPLPPLSTSVVANVLEGIRQCADDPERIHSIIDQTMKKYINPNYPN